jgi:hypothetical protein
MENKSNNYVKNSTSDISVAAISGGGTGTLLVLLAQNLLPENSPYEKLFVMLAPSASVAITSFWVWATAEFKKRQREKLIEKTLAEMLELLHKKLADPSVPPRQKKVYEKQLATLEEKNFQRRIRILDE